MSWPVSCLGDVSEFIRNGASIPQSKDAGGVPITRIESISERAFNQNKCGYADVGASEYLDYRLRQGDILVSHINSEKHLAKCAIFEDESFDVIHGMNLLCARPDQQKIFPRYLFHYLSSPKFLHLVPAITKKSVNQASFTVTAFKELPIPLPPLPEQKRIAAILDKADAIRRKRQQAIQLANEFLRAMFLDMFGDPVTNPKGWETERLEGLVKVVSGATPSKSNDAYWIGDFPWVSPKDMKSVEIGSSIDHINQVVFEQESLKKLPIGSVLIVVRGMILAHTVPVGITTAEVAINQDIKAFISSGGVLPGFLLWFLLSQHANLLSKVTTAAHGTKRFDMVDLLNLPVFVPDIEVQGKFVSIARSYKAALDELDWSHKDALELFNSLGQRAFAGQI